MSNYPNPGKKLFSGLSRCYIASKAGGLVLPHAIDIHPVSGKCNLDCRWCIGRFKRQTIDPLPNLMEGPGLILALKKILDPRWRSLWPSEFHFCGCDSEPLQSDAVLPAIRFLLQRKRVIELITNGLMLAKKEMVPAVARIRKLSISLDVTNDEDYSEFKFPEGSSLADGYTQVLKNIRSIVDYREKHESKLHISVTFVATPRTYEKEKWRKCFEELRDVGVKETFGPPIEELRTDMEDLDKYLANIKIRFISPEERYSEFPYCRGPRLWPALASDGCIYPCAHTATSEYQPFGDLLGAKSLFDLYQELFQVQRRNFVSVDEIGCHRDCPSVLGRYNEPSLAKKQLGRESYV